MEKRLLERFAVAARLDLLDAVWHLARQRGFSRYQAERAAATWYIRLCCLRYMEVKGYISERDYATPAALIDQCSAFSGLLPRLFGRNVETEQLMPPQLLHSDGLMHRIRTLLPRRVWDDVLIVGWLYQYYNLEKKNAVFAALKKNIKIEKENIPAATQLFTPEWLVRYMVQNTLGRLNLNVPSTKTWMEAWQHYLPDAPQEPSVVSSCSETPHELPDIRCIDPCMGSGHILCCLFDHLLQLYLASGYSIRTSVEHIIQHNIYGLDIDEHAEQLCSFALSMKARQHVSDWLENGCRPHVYALRESEALQGATHFGALLRPEPSAQLPPDAALLTQQYNIVITNPPYMGGRGMNPELNRFLQENYREAKADLFSAFMVRCQELAAEGGFISMLTQQAWMFLSSYEAFRSTWLRYLLIHLLHLGPQAFEEIDGDVVQTCCFVQQKRVLPSYQSVFCRLVEPLGPAAKEQAFLQGEGRFIASTDSFSGIPGKPLAYWASKALRHAFDQGGKLKERGEARQGMATSDNARFLRHWFEVDYQRLALGCRHAEEAVQSGRKWFPYNKGGEFRKWYGNAEYVVNYENNGEEIKAYAAGLYKTYTRSIKSESRYFQPCITWSKVTNGRLGVRLYPHGFIFDVAGCAIFYEDETAKLLDLAFLNSKVAQQLLGLTSPTMNYEVGHIASLPIRHIENEASLLEHIHACLSCAKADWDCFETSWDFKRHPFVGNYTSIDDANRRWTCVTRERFLSLQYHETQLNSYFINQYELQSEINPEVADSEITASMADEARDIRSFISYAVGCMFGRYSLDEDGLVYAGGIWDASRYKRMRPVENNIISLNDDIVNKFLEFLGVVFGAERLEENLRSVVRMLGYDVASPRESLLRYFVAEFYADHCRTYRKRPLYWLFDSGGKSGFKALMYVHRYTPDTLAHLYSTYFSDINAESPLRDYAEAVRIESLCRAPMDDDKGIKYNYAQMFPQLLAKIR